MSDENNKIGSIKTLFNEMKMRDFSILDFFKFKNHLINFCILSFLWAVYNFVKYGIASTMSEILVLNVPTIFIPLVMSDSVRLL